MEYHNVGGILHARWLQSCFNPRKLRSVHGERDRIAFSYGEMLISIAESLVSQKDGSASLGAR